MDPRAPATTETLDQQFRLAESIYAQVLQSRKAMAELESVDHRLKKIAAADTPEDLKIALKTAQEKLDTIRDGTGSADASGLAAAASGLGTVLRVVESGDREAPASALEIFAQMRKASTESIAAWQHFKAADLVRLNDTLTAAHREPIHIAAIEEEVHYAMTR
jgi:hypothetical protein